MKECPFKYEDEETGLYYNRFRFYDSSTGTYLSQDPIGLAGGTRLYGYVENPTTWIDPLGWHGNSLDNIADSDLYHIVINGKTFKHGIANATPERITKTDISIVRPNGDITIIPAGTPTRLKDQLRKAYSNYDDVSFSTERHNGISTEKMKEIETSEIQAHVDSTGKVPSGNKAHAHIGEVANDFKGVHDLKKDTKMKNNKAKNKIGGL